MSVLAAVNRDLKRIAAADKALGEGALAESARVLARELDKPNNSATSKSMCARALTEVLNRLRELKAPATKGDRVDELEARRAKRIRRRAAR